jgi:hypothetical protein
MKNQCDKCNGSGKVLIGDCMGPMYGNCPQCTLPVPNPPPKRIINEDIGLVNWIIRLFKYRR